MASDVVEPINIGSDELVTHQPAGRHRRRDRRRQAKRRYKLDAPKGVRGRNSDNALVENALGWSPGARLEDGLRKTYEWIADAMSRTEATPTSA